MEDESLMVERADIEAKARQIESAIAETKEAAQNTAVLAGVAVIVVVILAFLFGRRKGKAGKAVVEVYRVK
jgi:hypothetical protein